MHLVFLNVPCACNDMHYSECWLFLVQTILKSGTLCGCTFSLCIYWEQIISCFSQITFFSWPPLKLKCQTALVDSFIWCHTGACNTAEMNFSLSPQTSQTLSFHFQTKVYLNDYEKYQGKKKREGQEERVLMVNHSLNITGVKNNFRVWGVLIKILRSKKLPSTIKCHCRSFGLVSRNGEQSGGHIYRHRDPAAHPRG